MRHSPCQPSPGGAGLEGCPQDALGLGVRGGLGQQGRKRWLTGRKLQKQKHRGEHRVQDRTGSVAGLGRRGHPVPGRKSRPGPTSFDCYAKGFRLDATGEGSHSEL